MTPPRSPDQLVMIEDLADHTKASLINRAIFGSNMAYAFDQLCRKKKSTLVMHAYVAALYKEGHSFGDIESILGSLLQYFEEAVDCWGGGCVFVPNTKASIIRGRVKIEEPGETIGHPVFDGEFTNSRKDFKAHGERSEGFNSTNWPPGRDLRDQTREQGAWSESQRQNHERRRNIKQQCKEKSHNSWRGSSDAVSQNL